MKDHKKMQKKKKERDVLKTSRKSLILKRRNHLNWEQGEYI
jgi:hypothetical protein